MAHFFLNLNRTDGICEDPDGSDFPNLEAARAEAFQAAREILSMAISAGQDTEVLSVQIVRDGETLDEVPLTSALPATLIRRVRATQS